MTIEIKQLVIRAVVDAGRELGQSGERSPAAPVSGPAPAPIAASAKIDPEALRSACAHELRRELRKLRER